MGMFRKTRRNRQSGAHDSAANRPSALTELLHDIAGAAAAPEDALEPALRAILEASGARAGAICLFDPRQGILRLATEVGLSDDGCRRLRNVRRADPTTWDMPLHGLLNRRAYLIESASRNRYVPRLVENFSSVRTVACIPIYGGPSPLGSLVLIALAPRSFVERDIRNIERPLREVAKMIESVRRRGGAGVGPAYPTVSFAPFKPAELTAVIAERDRLREELAARAATESGLAGELSARGLEIERLQGELDDATHERTRLSGELERIRRDAERASLLSASLDTAERERARLAAALEAAAAERSESARAQSALEQARGEAERAARTAAAELEVARRAAAESTATAVRRASERAAEAERLQTRLAEAETALSRERDLVRQRELEQQRLALELRAATAREQQLRDEAQAGHRGGRQEDLHEALAQIQAAETARAIALAEVEAARSALATSQAIVDALEEEAAHAHSDIDEFAVADEAERAEQDRLRSALGEAERRSDEAAARFADLEQEVRTLREERARLESAGRERAAELATLSAHIETLAAERDRLREAGEALAAERDRLSAEAAAAASAATTAQARLEEALNREIAERERLGAVLQAREAEVAERAAEIEQLRAAQASTGATKEAEVAERESVRVVTVAPSASPARIREIEPGRRIVAVIDADARWEATTLDGHQVIALTPGEEAIERLNAMDPARVIVNLAAPGALETMATLRAAGSTIRFWGCLASADVDRALPLGIVEAAGRPIDCDTILTGLGPYAVRGARVVTAGADVDELMSLRQAMARRQMSVSMAWDGKQATDLLGVVRPDVVVVDLDLPKRDGFAIVARVGTLEPIPTVLLIPGNEDTASAFTAILTDPMHASRGVPFEQLLKDSLGRSELPPAERRPQKIRALGRK
jgi:CheY-like chemotaxis protein